MDSYISQAIKANASDVFFITGTAPVMRVDGVLQTMGKETLKDKQIRDYFSEHFTPAQAQTFKETQDLDFRIEVNGTTIRVNLHEQHRGVAAALRIIQPQIPAIDAIGLTDIAQFVSQQRNGLILVTGMAGSGKSTTVASLLSHINATRAAHVITVEDPIEYVFEDDKSVFEQREVTVDTPTFNAALRHVLRQNPDILFIGEMRDPESIAAALTAAETGHLVFSTLHTPSAAETIERIIDLFSAERQKQILIQLASSLRMVISQRLLPKKKGGLVAAREILVNTPAVANLIRNNNPSQITSTIQTGKKEGMITMERAVKALEDEAVV